MHSRMENLTNVCEATSQSHDLEHSKPTHRKGKKLLAEKKRRARINNCLLQIRDLVCDGDEEKDTDLDKMEKAEILEKTLEVLTRLRHESSSATHTSTFSTRKAMAVRYASGFSSCAEESIRYIQNSRLVPSEVKVQLQTHLRAIARRMETVVQVDNQGLNVTPPYSALRPSSSSSSVSYDNTLPMDRMREDSAFRTYDRMSCPVDMSEVRGYYIPSPIHTSTPTLQQSQHLPYNAGPLLQYQTDPERIYQTPDICVNQNFVEMQQKPREKQFSDTVGEQTKNKLDSAEEIKPHSSYSPEVHKPQVCYSDSSKDQQYTPSYSSPSSDALCPLTVPYTSPGSSSVILTHPPVLPTSPLVADQPVYSYHGYEPYPTVPSILVQPIQYVTTPIKAIPVTTTVVTTKQPTTPSNALDLCVKGNDQHKISPETMWRPW